jgi:EmrB/QacA subfamily drug resistance transporter
MERTGAVPSALPASRERGLMFTVALAATLAPLNSTMLAVALPRIMRDLHAGVAGAGWLISTYLIAMASLQPAAGKLGDRLGRRRLFLLALAWFGAASVGATFAPSLIWLLIFRLQQAIAAAASVPNGAALIREAVPVARRASRFGLIGSATALAASAGPPIGGALATLLGWRSLFLLNVVLVIPALAVGLRVIPHAAPPTDPRSFDVAGAAGMLVLLSASAWTLTELRSFDRRVGIGAVVVLGVGSWLLRHELNHPDPVVQPRFFRRRAFAGANGGFALGNIAMYSMLLVLPQLLDERAGWTSARAGLVLAAMFSAMIVMAPVGGALADRLGRRAPVTAGYVVLGSALTILAAAGPGISIRNLVLCLAVGGIGLGSSSAGQQAAAVEAVGPADAGMAAGVYSTSRYIGSIVGTSLMAGMLSRAGAGFEAVFVMCALGAWCAALASLWLPGRSR